MKKYWSATRILLSQITRDYMLFMALFAPILAGVAIHFLLPVLDSLLAQNGIILFLVKDYGLMFDLLLMIVAPLMVGFIGAMVILQEMDEKMVGYYSVTPLKRSGYLITRLFFPTLVGSLYSIFVTLLFHISGIAIWSIFVICLFSGFLGCIVSLFIVAISSNKVEGMALGKLSGVLILGVFIPFIIPNATQYICFFLPSFWIGKFVICMNLPDFILGLLTAMVWFVLLYRKFIKRSFA